MLYCCDDGLEVTLLVYSADHCVSMSAVRTESRESHPCNVISVYLYDCGQRQAKVAMQSYNNMKSDQMSRNHLQAIIDRQMH